MTSNVSYFEVKCRFNIKYAIPHFTQWKIFQVFYWKGKSFVYISIVIFVLRHPVFQKKSTHFISKARRVFK